MKYAKTLLLVAFVFALLTVQLLTAPYRIPAKMVADLFTDPTYTTTDTIQALIHGDRLGLDPAVLISVPDSIRRNATGYTFDSNSLYLVMGDSLIFKILLDEIYPLLEPPN